MNVRGLIAAPFIKPVAHILGPPFVFLPPGVIVSP